MIKAWSFVVGFLLKAWSFVVGFLLKVGSLLVTIFLVAAFVFLGLQVCALLLPAYSFLAPPLNGFNALSPVISIIAVLVAVITLLHAQHDVKESNAPFVVVGVEIDSRRCVVLVVRNIGQGMASNIVCKATPPITNASGEAIDIDGFFKSLHLQPNQEYRLFISQYDVRKAVFPIKWKLVVSYRGIGGWKKTQEFESHPVPSLEAMLSIPIEQRIESLTGELKTLNDFMRDITNIQQPIVEIIDDSFIKAVPQQTILKSMRDSTLCGK